MTRPRLRGRPGRSVTPRGERTKERSAAAHPGRGGGPPGRERAGRPARRPRVRCAARRPVGRAGVGSSRARPAPTPSAVITAPDPAEESAACPVPRRRGAWCRTHGSLGDAAPRRARHRAPDQLAGPVPLTPAEGSTSTPSCSVAGPVCSQERTPRPEQHHGNREHYRPAPPGERPRTDRVNDRPPRPCTSSFRRRRNVPARAARKGRDRVPRTRRRSPDAPTGAEESRGVAAPAIVTKPSRPYGVCVRPVGSSPIGEPRRMAPSHTPRWVRAGNPIRAPGVSPIHRAWLGGG